MKKLFKKIGEWWRDNIGYYHYMRNQKKRFIKNSRVNIYTDID